MRIGLIIPDRGDRRLFFEHCKWLIKQQTIQPIVVAFMDYSAESQEKDITQRYRRGYDQLRGQKLDAILLWENDDWYSPRYIETMITAWSTAGKPDIFGTRYTHYYSLRKWAYFTMKHTERSSAMSTLIKPDMDFDWPVDTEPYTDTHLWMAARHKDTNALLSNAVFAPDPIICLGIKHGIGLSGGNYHNNKLNSFIYPDLDTTWLRSVVDPTSYDFYRSVQLHRAMQPEFMP